MLRRTRFLVAGGCAALIAATSSAAFADDDDEVGTEVSELVVTARRLDQARAEVAASLGATTYTLTGEAVEDRPLGETANLGQLLMQAPGVTRSNSNRVQIRAQGEVQYRINNVIVPEGLGDVSETLSSRLVDKVDVMTGALPAQYGLQSGGVINVITKNGVYNQGGQVELYGGSHADIEPAYEYVGHFNATSIFSSGAYRISRQGLPSPDGSLTAMHDRTRQLGGMVFIDHIISEESRASLILGGSDNWFQLPHPRGINAASFGGVANEPFVRPLNLGGATAYASESWGGVQRDTGGYALASYQHTEGAVTVQASMFARYTTVALRPDRLGDLLFLGAARTANNSDFTRGLQIEAAYQANESHTLRAGVLATRTTSDNRHLLQVLPIDGAGRQTSVSPLEIDDRISESRRAAGVFVQDEWKLGARLTANPGLRFDQEPGAGGGRHLSPRLNLVWKSDDGLTLHGGYARYFAPAPELETPLHPAAFAGTTGALASGLAEPALAELDDYFDIGLQQKIGRLVLGLDGYWRSAKNLIDRASLGQTSLTLPFNYAEGRVRGVEFTATYARGPLSGWANLAISRAEGRRIVSNQAIFTAAELAFVADRFVATSQDQTWTASAGGSYRLNDFIFSAQMSYGSGVPRTPVGGAPHSERMAAHAQVDLSAGYNITLSNGRPLMLRADLVNLFDSRDRLSDGTSLGRGAPSWAEGRGVLLGVEQPF